MKVYYVISEAAPFSKTGNLGELMGALPAAVSSLGASVWIVTPLYGGIPDSLRAEMRFVKTIRADLAQRSCEFGLFTLLQKGVTWYFLDNGYFRRPELYGYDDDAERFAFFCKGAISLLAETNLTPDVVHACDWQGSLALAYLKLAPEFAPLKGIKTVFTLTDTKIQGKLPKEAMTGLLGLGLHDYYNGTMEHDGLVNPTKGAVMLCDRITVMNSDWAKKVQSPEFGNGLDEVFAHNSFKLTGIAMEGEEGPAGAKSYLTLYNSLVG